MGDPYARMLEVLRGESSEETKTGETVSAGLGARPAKMRLGTVSQREPLRVKVMGIEQPTESLRINERLLKGAVYKTKVTSPNSDFTRLYGSLDGQVDCAGGHGSPRLGQVNSGDLHSDETTIDEATVKLLETDLDVDDQVLLLTEDDQIFYILMKVVRAV